MSVEVMLTLVCDRCGGTTAEELTDEACLVRDLVEDRLEQTSWGWDPDDVEYLLCDECLKTALEREQS